MNPKTISTLVFGAAVLCTAIGGLTLAPMLSQSVAAQDDDERVNNEAVRVDAEDEETPQATYRRLIEKKLGLIQPHELQDEIRKLQEELADREAFRKLDQTRQQLEELIQVHPNSQAARAAQQMLRAGHPFGREGHDFNNPRPRNSNTFESGSVPEPDEDFAPVRARERAVPADELEQPFQQEEQRRKPNNAPEKLRRPRNPTFDNNS